MAKARARTKTRRQGKRTDATGQETYQSMSPSQFFYEYREVAGFGNATRALYQTVRELVENALDATEAQGILPNIRIEIHRDENVQNYYTVTVEDNGIGIDPKYVPNAFGKVLFSSKYKLRQTRGRFGLGAKMAILYGQVTTGRPVTVYTSPKGSRKIYLFKIKIDIRKNEPIILEESVLPNPSKWHGLRISVTIEGGWAHAKSRIYDYIMRTAVITPYADIVFMDPDGNMVWYKRSISKLPVRPKEVKPHPRGVDIELLKQLIRQTNAETLLDFMVTAFQGVGKITAKKFLEFAKLDPNIDPRSLSDSDLEYLARKLREYDKFRAPSSDALSPIGADVIEAGLKAIFKPEFVAAVTRKPQAYEGHPFIVEVGIAYGGKIESRPAPLLLRYANKIPLLYDEKNDVAWKVIDPERFDWRQYLVSFPAPLAVLTHICSTKVPYKGLGKESVADVVEIERELANAVKEVARKLRNYLAAKKREEEVRRRITTFLRYIPEVARGLATIFHTNGISEKELEERLKQAMAKRIGLEEKKLREYLEKTLVSIKE